MSSAVSVLVKFKILPECIEAFKAEIANIAPIIQAEQECLFFDVTQSVEDRSKFTVYETWSSKDYFENVQLKKPYYEPYVAATQKMWEVDREFETFEVLWTSRDVKA